MHRSTRPARPLLRLAGALAATALVALGTASPAAAATATSLHGTFVLQAGSCAGGGTTGSYFRMILHSGGPNGPFLSNSSSACSDQTYTLLAPGTDHGLVPGTYQPGPSPAFDSSGNGRAGRITKPTRFYGVDFAAATSAVDPQTGTKVPAPVVTAQGTALSADLRSFGVSWNNQQFNQGSPKPDGSLPGSTRRATGTLDPHTGAFTLQWTSQIQGGPFDGFTGLWHLTGRFTPTGAPTTTPPTHAAGGSGTPGATPTASGATLSSPAALAGTPGATAAPTATPTPDATTPAGSATSTPEAGTPAPGPGGGTTDLAAAHGSGGTRWPWVLLAAVLALGTGGLVLRLRSRA